jgi:hypothetical protein
MDINELLRLYSTGERNFSRINLEYANLCGVNLQDANLEYACLREVDLREADLRRVNLHATNLEDADLRKTNLQEANLTEADLSGASLREANLTNAIMTSATLEFTDLCEANLTGANLEGVSLKETKLERANISGTILELRVQEAEPAPIQTAVAFELSPTEGETISPTIASEEIVEPTSSESAITLPPTNASEKIDLTQIEAVPDHTSPSKDTARESMPTETAVAFELSPTEGETISPTIASEEIVEPTSSESAITLPPTNASEKIDLTQIEAAPDHTSPSKDTVYELASNETATTKKQKSLMRTIENLFSKEDRS